jgi:DNA repair protein RadC
MEPPGFPGRFTARLLGLPLLDHIILTARSHFSFREV